MQSQPRAIVCRDQRRTAVNVQLQLHLGPWDGAATQRLRELAALRCVPVCSSEMQQEVPVAAVALLFDYAESIEGGHQLLR